MSGQLVVAVSDGGDLALHDLLVEWVQEDLLVLLSIDVNPNSPSCDIGWEALKAKRQLIDRCLSKCKLIINAYI